MGDSDAVQDLYRGCEGPRFGGRSYRQRGGDRVLITKEMAGRVQHHTVVVVLIGVTGVGKTTIGKALADRLGWAFVDGDDLHPKANVSKMAAGEPLSDEDRAPWLETLHGVLMEHVSRNEPLVLACSALRTSYRSALAGEAPGIRFVYLTGDPMLIARRLERRHGHFMPPSLLGSQLRILEPPPDAFTVDVGGYVDEIVETIVRELDLPIASRRDDSR